MRTGDDAVELGLYASECCTVEKTFKSGDLRPAIAAAWCNAAPKKLAREFEASFK